MKQQWNAPRITRIVCPALALAVVISTQGLGHVVISNTGGRLVFEQTTINGALTVSNGWPTTAPPVPAPVSQDITFSQCTINAAPLVQPPAAQ